MTLMYRELQRLVSNGFFRLEFAGQFHQQRTLIDVTNSVLGKRCQKI